MVLTLESAILELRRAVPSFPIDSDWEVEGLLYPIFNDFARFICSAAEVLQYVTSDAEANRLSQVPICMEFLERALKQGDPTVRDLVHECVETLSECTWSQQIKKWVGPQTSAIWEGRS
jgi:hypothetical protein